LGKESKDEREVSVSSLTLTPHNPRSSLLIALFFLVAVTFVDAKCKKKHCHCHKHCHCVGLILCFSVKFFVLLAQALSLLLLLVSWGFDMEGLSYGTG
jgi:hypothetical protein